MYRQCSLRRGVVVSVAWIPVPLARADSYLRIGKVDGWKIEKVYLPEMDAEKILMLRDQHRNAYASLD